MNRFNCSFDLGVYFRSIFFSRFSNVIIFIFGIAVMRTFRVCVFVWMRFTATFPVEMNAHDYDDDDDHANVYSFDVLIQFI